MTEGLGTNIEAIKAIGRISKTTQALEKVSERLSSGQRINRASDDAAGLAIASNLSNKTRLYTQAIRNASDGISALSIVEGALQSVGGIVDRLSELAEQSANGIYSAKQKSAMDAEAQQLGLEYERILLTTKFNGQQVFSSATNQLQIGVTGEASSVLTVRGYSELVLTTVGDGTFSNPVSTSAGANRVFTLASGDFNNDGFDDLVSQSDSGGGTMLYSGSSSGIGAAVTLSNQSGGNPLVGDLNGDGNLDLITDFFPNQYIWLGNGDGTFRQSNGGAVSSAGENTFLADVTGDSKLDIIRADGTSVILQRGNGDGSFTGATTLLITAVPANGQAAIGDANGDGLPDLFVPYGGTVSIIGFTSGTPVLNSTLPISTGSARRVGVGDTNNDGIDDLVYGGGSGTFVRLGNGSSTFGAATQISTRDFGIKLNDLNSDGYNDVIMYEEFGVDDATHVRLSNGDGTFKAVTSYVMLSRYDVEAGDYNGDGAKDLAVSNSGNNTVTVLSGNPVVAYHLPVFNLLTSSSALSALDMLSNQRTAISKGVGIVGSLQSRIMTAQSNSSSARENTSAAYSQIVDADMAQETTQYIRLRILQQSGAAVLASISQSPSLTLALLK